LDRSDAWLARWDMIEAVELLGILIGVTVARIAE
jgi:hypothetical protein